MLFGYESKSKSNVVVSRAYLIPPHRAYPHTKLKVIYAKFIFLKILTENKILMDHPKLDVVNINA